LVVFLSILFILYVPLLSRFLFAADGKYCLTGGHDRTVRLWNPARLDPAFPPAVTMGNNSFSRGNDPDDVDAAVPVEGLPRALPIQTYADGLTHPVTAIAVDEGSTTLLSACDKTLCVTDVVTQQVKRRLQGHAGQINAVAISDHSETYLTASYDATVRIWDGRSRSHEPIQILKQAKDSVTNVHVVQDDSGSALIRTASVDGNVRTYDLRMGVIRSDDCGSSITSMAPTHDGECLAVSCLDGTIRLLGLDSGELVNTYDSHHVAGQYGLECCVTSDDQTIVSGSEDGNVVLYDLVRATRSQSLQGHTRPTCSVAAHPLREFSSVVITASFDGNAIVWANNADYMKWQD
jgi:mitogen-activated protein kinase organizer 1